MTRRTNTYLLAVMGLIAASASAVPLSAKSVAARNNVSVAVEGGQRIIRANGIPRHAVGQFPNRRNPNAISEQNYVFRVPMNPVPANTRNDMRHMMFGVALNGVPFDPGTAEYYNNDRRAGWRYEALSGKIDLGLDRNNAHVQPNGAYHYHGLPRGLLSELAPDKHSPLVGYAADGFPIYALYGYADPRDPAKGVKQMMSSWRLRSGIRGEASGPGGRFDGTYTQDWQFVDGAGDLDESNARFTVTPEYPNGIFAYFITDGFPMIPRSFVGTPDGSFRKGPPGGRHGGPGRFGRPRHGHSGHRPPPRHR